MKNFMMEVEEACDVYVAPPTRPIARPQEVLDEIKQEFGQMGADHAEAYLTEMFGEPL
jgi:hypothetical protein